MLITPTKLKFIKKTFPFPLLRNFKNKNSNNNHNKTQQKQRNNK